MLEREKTHQKEKSYKKATVRTLMILALSFSTSASENSTLPTFSTDNPACSVGIWKYVHDPERLIPVGPDACVERVTGTIVYKHDSEDGDIWMLVKPDPEYENLLNPENTNDGNLVVEAICQNPSADEDYCQGFTNKLDIPPVGSHVLMTGWHVEDSDNNNWSEIHPLEKIITFPPKKGI